MADDLGAIHYLGAGSGAPAVVGVYDVWQLYGLDQLWEMVRDEDGVVSFTQVGAWHRMAELCSEQADQLQRALDQLMVHWPARPGSASELFQQTVGRLIGSMRNSAAVATATKQPLADITTALGRAKDEVGVLVARKAVYDQQEKALAARGVYPGRGATAALAPSDQIPPEGWRQQLDRQARQILATADSNVGAAATHIGVSERYEFDAHAEATVPYQDPAGGNSGPRASGNASAAPFPPFDPPAADRSAVAEPPEQSIDPVLDGGPITPGAPPASGNGSLFDGPTEGRGGPSQTAAALVPGGLIGGPRASGSAASSSGRGGSVRSTGSVPGGGPMIAPPSRGMAGGRGDLGQSAVRAGGRRRRRSDPADPWAVPQGGPSVLEPDREPVEHDPGPGVIGLDR